MKTTLNISDRLLAEAKANATRQHTSLTRFIEQGIRLRLQRERHANHTAEETPDIPVFAGKQGLQPGIDPTSNQSLYDAAD
jgi:hypothetical protein